MSIVNTGVILTEKAAIEVKRVMAENDTEAGTMLRIGVTGGGCSGLSYDFRFDEEFDEANDNKTEQHGITPVSYTHLTLPTIYSV